jgi:hypothetical protein
MTISNLTAHLLFSVLPACSLARLKRFIANDVYEGCAWVPLGFVSSPVMREFLEVFLEVSNRFGGKFGGNYVRRKKWR